MAKAKAKKKGTPRPLAKKMKPPEAGKSGKPAKGKGGAMARARSAVSSAAKAATKAVKTVAKKLKSAAKSVRPDAKAKAKDKSLKEKSQAAASGGPQAGTGSVCHVEFSTPDLDAAKSFWSELVGLDFHPMGPNELYFHGKSGWGPGGCMVRGEPSCASFPVIYFQVTDIPASLQRATNMGAEQVKAKTEIPGGHGFYAHFKAPDGNLFGLWSRQ